MIDYGGGDNDDNNAVDVASRDYNGSPPFPIVNQSLDQQLLQPFSLQVQRFSDWWGGNK